MAQIELIATAPFGLEAVVEREVRELGYDPIKVENGKVTFLADELGICRSNLWLRTADRVLVKMGEFRATTFDELFEQTKALAWPEWITEDAEFPVEGKSIKSQLSSVPACQSIVKKAIVDKMTSRYNTEWFEETGARYTIEVALLKDVATLSIDTSGPGLHKRGYRKLSTDAPLKETLAAAMVSLSRWGAHRPLADPLCGSGTIPIEAALMAHNIAPGISRSFAAEEWPRIPHTSWQQARVEARDLERRQIALDIVGTDINPEAISLAEYHVRQAGVARSVRLETKAVQAFHSDKKYGCIITNPPYGERLGDRSEAEQLYSDMGYSLSKLDTWSLFVLTSNFDFEVFFGTKATKKRKLYNARLECCLYQYLGPLPPRNAENH